MLRLKPFRYIRERQLTQRQLMVDLASKILLWLAVALFFGATAISISVLA